MNDQRLAHTVRRALGSIIDEAPAPAPWPLQAVPEVPTARRWMVPAAAVAVGAIGASAVVWAAGRNEQDATDVPRSPMTTTPVPTTSPSGVFVSGPPTCGSQLPLMIEMVDSSGPQSGPAPGVGIEQAPGQYVEHWDFAEGSLEFRWPADDGDFMNDGPLPLDIAIEFSGGVGDEGAYFVGLTLHANDETDDVPTVVVPEGGGWEHGEQVGLSADVHYLAVIGWSPRDPVTQQVPCDVVQVRFVDPSGAWRMYGFPLRELRLNEAWATLDLYARVSATAPGGTVAEPPVPFSSPDCPASDHEPYGLPMSIEPVEALDVFLSSHDALSLPQSAYEELYDSSGDRYFYVRYLEDDPDLIAIVITVERDEAGWIVTRWQTTCG